MKIAWPQATGTSTLLWSMRTLSCYEYVHSGEEGISLSAPLRLKRADPLLSVAMFNPSRRTDCLATCAQDLSHYPLMPVMKWFIGPSGACENRWYADWAFRKGHLGFLWASATSSSAWILIKLHQLPSASLITVVFPIPAIQANSSLGMAHQCGPSFHPPIFPSLYVMFLQSTNPYSVRNPADSRLCPHVPGIPTGVVLKNRVYSMQKRHF